MHTLFMPTTQTATATETKTRAGARCSPIRDPRAQAAIQAAAIAEIAAKVGHIETLEIRGRDGLDFHDLSVWVIREMLEAAYEAGRAAK